jgi:translation initiation factor IF-3
LHRINNEITVPEVRVVGGEGEEDNGVMNIRKALALAEERGMDLVEINAAQDPPICRIIEYTKFKYEQNKREKEKKKKQHIVQMKEIRFGPNTDQHDFDFKLNHAKKFLEEGNKVKAYVHFRGRTIVYTDRGKKLLLEFADSLSDQGKVEMLPKLEGKRMYIILTPKAGPAKK